MAAVSGKLLPRKIADPPKAYRYLHCLTGQRGFAQAPLPTGRPGPRCRRRRDRAAPSPPPRRSAMPRARVFSAARPTAPPHEACGGADAKRRRFACLAGKTRRFRRAAAQATLAPDPLHDPATAAGTSRSRSLSSSSSRRRRSRRSLRVVGPSDLLATPSPPSPGPGDLFRGGQGMGGERGQ
jgi:hypothetical protein